MAIKIDTEIVRSTASKISFENKKINYDFSAAESAVKTLGRYWEGNAYDVAATKFRSIKNDFSSNRFNVVNDMVNFMLKQVAEEYENTETAISSAASAFK